MLRDTKFDQIVAVPRGGWPVAVHLSYHFDKPVKSIYDPGFVLKRGERVIVVDNVYNTGKTIDTAWRCLKSETEPRFAVLISRAVAKVNSSLNVVAAKTVGYTDYIYFPWEIGDGEVVQKKFNKVVEPNSMTDEEIEFGEIMDAECKNGNKR
jgi:hypoxanthine phosphoribosyltransferase